MNATTDTNPLDAASPLATSQPLAVATGSASSDLDFLTICVARDMIAKLKAENERMKTALDEIHTTAHCISLAGPLKTPTLDEAWRKFDRIAVMATAALWPQPNNSCQTALYEIEN